jgi:hypothetical protein
MAPPSEQLDIGHIAFGRINPTDMAEYWGKPDDIGHIGAFGLN